MENPLRLYHTLLQVLCKHRNWLDIRHLKTLAWMMAGLMQSGTIPAGSAGTISLTAWVPYVHGRAVYAQSTVRRFMRWLNNPRIKVHSLYGPLIQQALAEWGCRKLYLALDTSMLWGQFCWVRISVSIAGVPFHSFGRFCSTVAVALRMRYTRTCCPRRQSCCRLTLSRGVPG
jgi:hypothetical protein